VSVLASAVNADVRALEPLIANITKDVADQDENKARNALAAVATLAR
jgi:hypothetical protein